MQKKQNNYSGITITLKNQTQRRRGQKLSALFGFIAQLAILLAAVYGSLFSFFSMMNPAINKNTVLIELGVCALVFMLLFTLIKKRRYIICAVVAVVCIAAFAVCYNQALNGLYCIIDSTREAICASMNWSVPDPIGNSGTALYDSTLLVLIVQPLLVMGIGFFIAARVNFLVVFLLTFPFFEIGAAYGCVPDYISFSLMLSSWVGVIVLHTANRAKVRVRSKNGGRRRRSSRFIEKNRAGKFALSAAALAVAVFVLFTASHDILVNMGYSRTDKMDMLRRDVRTVYSDIFDLITGEDRDGSLKEGRLYKLGDLKIKNRHYITVQMPNSAEPVYLRGYVGGSYVGNEWVDLDSYTENEKLFDEFRSQKLLAGALQGKILDSSLNNFLLSAGNFSLSDFRRQKNYSYTTYGALLSTELGYSAYYDKSVYAQSSADYGFKAYFEQGDLYKVKRQPLFIDPTFRAVWSRYTAFVKANYIALPDTVSQSVLNIGRSAKGNDYKKVDYVRDYLSKNTEYSLFSKTLPANTDFVNYFLENQKYGYSAHYASAAAVLLRAAGVPTRYVEGYLIGTDKINSSQNVGSDLIKKVDVTDADAHAWIEIYDKSYGWLPVEVTPGFYSGSFEDYVNKESEKGDFEPEDEPEEEPDEAIETDLEEERNNASEVEPDTPQDGEGIGITYVGNQQGDTATTIISTLLIILVLLVAAIAALILRRLIRNRIRRKWLDTGDPNKRVFAAFNYFTRLLRFDGAQVKNISSYSKFIEYIRENAEFLPLDGLNDMIDTALAAGFSDSPVDDEQASRAIGYVNGYAIELYEAAGFFNRIKFKYIFNLK